MRRLRDRLDAGAAQAIHRDRRRFGLQAGLQSDVARAIDCIGAGLHHVAENGVVEIYGIHSGTPDGLFRRVRRKPDCGNIGKRSGVTRHRRARSRHNDNIGWEHESSFRSNLEFRCFQGHDGIAAPFSRLFN